MGGFAVGQAYQNLDAAGTPDSFAPAPLDFGSQVAASFDAGWSVDRLGARDEAWRSALWGRHDDMQKATGQTLQPSTSMAETLEASTLSEASSPADIPRMIPQGVVSDADYQARMAKLRQAQPQAMAGIPDDQTLHAQLAQHWNAVEARAGQAGLVPRLIGSAGAAVADPLNLVFGLATAGVGEGAPLALSLLRTGAAWAGVAAAEAPFKHIEAADQGGPAYGLPEAVTDVIESAVGAPLAELGLRGFGRLVGATSRLALGKLRGLADAAPAARGALDQLDQAELIDRALGPMDGPTHAEALDALTTLKPLPEQPPGQDLPDLFGEGPRAPLPDQTGPAAITGQADYRGRQIFQGTFDPAAIETAPQAFQYKADADAHGVTARLKGVEAWDPTASGKVILYQPSDGRLVIADGHQRLALAKRLDAKGFEPRLDGYLFREADGWTAQQVRTVAALKNIREGSGTILDAAKIFRDAPAALEDRSLPVTGDFVTQARALARLTPEAFGAVVNKVVPERYAAEIGAMAGDRPDLHAGLMRLLHAGEPASIDEARSLVSEGLLDDWIKSEGEQTNLFGDLPAESSTIARAKVKASVLNALRKDARIFGQLVRHADAIEAGGNALLRDANEQAAAVSRTALEVLSRLSLRAGDVGDAMASAAREVLEGKRPADAAKGIVQMVRNRLAAGEQLDGLRLAEFDPKPPTPQAEALLAKVDDPKAWEAVAKAAPEDAKLEALPKAGEPPQPLGKGGLWQASPEQLRAMLDEKATSDEEKLVQALGEDGAKEFKRLDRMQNSADPQRADEGARLFDEKFGNLTPDQQRLVYGVGETDAPAEDIQAVLKAHGDVAAVDPDEWLGYMAAVAARKLTAEDLAKVPAGTASAEAQAAFVRMHLAYQEMAARGINPDSIPTRMVDALVNHAGWNPAEAREVIGGFLQDMVKARAERGPPVGLFDDLNELGGEERAHQRLIACAPEE